MNINRLLIVLVFIVAVFFALAARLFNLQILKSEELKYFAQRQQTATETIQPERGLIYDRNNVLLAYSRDDITFLVDTRMLKKKNADTIAYYFSKYFKKPASYYLDKMNNTKGIVYLERKVNGEAALRLKTLKVNGFKWESDPTRIYPYDNLASHILGFVGNDGTGRSGVERTFEQELQGTPGSRIILRDAKGNMITLREESVKPAVPGNNLYLTINKSIQSALEEELREGKNNFGATDAIGIVLNPKTGEILALSNIEDYNPNKYNLYSDTLLRNKALTDTYEPGSTFKAISMSVMLDKNVCNENEILFVENGTYHYKSIVIKDAHPYSNLSVKEIFTKSSNIGMSKLSQRIDKESFYVYLRNFGFGNCTNIELPAETPGVLKKPSNWTEYTKSSLSFGYEISLTPLQLIMAYATLINGGLLYQPQLIYKSESGNKSGIKNFTPVLIRRVISEETSKKMRNLFSLVVEEGTGKKAKINNITVGGKTGTSRKLVNGQYSTSHYNSSFIGFFPVENPAYIILILVDSPSKNSYYGGDVAAPIFRNVAERIISLDSELQKFNSSVEEENNYSLIENAIAKNNSIKDTSVNIVKVKPRIDETKLNNKYFPDLRGMTFRDAIKVLTRLGVKYELSGTGKIISQNILPNTTIRKGMKCVLTGEQANTFGAVIY